MFIPFYIVYEHIFLSFILLHRILIGITTGAGRFLLFLTDALYGGDAGRDEVNLLAIVSQLRAIGQDEDGLLAAQAGTHAPDQGWKLCFKIIRLAHVALLSSARAFGPRPGDHCLSLYQHHALIGDVGGGGVAQRHGRAGPAAGILQRLEIRLAADGCLDPGMAAIMCGEARNAKAPAERADALGVGTPGPHPFQALSLVSLPTA